MKNIPLTKPYFDEKEEKAIIKVLRSGWHTQGPIVENFEKQFAKYVHSKYAVAVSNCTTALHLALIIAGVKKNDEILVPSFTFVATANVIVETGATPIFVDVDERTFNINPKDIEGKITKQTKAIIIVDQVGLPSDFKTIKKLASKHGLLIIEDAACAIGSMYKKKRVGENADITCFSFHPRKLISTGEGGMITTNIKEYAEKARMLRSHGASISDRQRHGSKKVSIETYKEAGFNYRMTDIQAAIGLEQLKKLPKILSKRKLLAERYNKKLGMVNMIEIPYIPSYATPNWQSYIVTLITKKLSQRNFMQRLMDEGITTRRGVMACHLEPFYKTFVNNVSLPITEKLVNTTVCIPLYPQMTLKDQDFVIKKIKEVLS